VAAETASTYRGLRGAAIESPAAQRSLHRRAPSANFPPPDNEREAESDPRATDQPRAFFRFADRQAPLSGEGATMTRRKKIYEGKAKILYEGPEPGTLIQYFKDDTTAFDATKKAVLEGKGVINNRISEYIMTRLNSIGVQNHFIKRLNLREQLIREVEIIPLEVVCRNVAAGSLSTRFGLPEGQPLPRSIIEFYLKDDKLHDPMVAEEHITAFNWATTQEIDDMMALTLRVNDFLTGMFGAVGITLVDFKIEFGRVWENEFSRIILADEISPDSCRLWDSQTNEKLDKDRFRRDLGNVIESYTEVARRLGIMKEMPTVIQGGLH
jgi:phosphoribosylaminoimidazole-succinocarboxamide synthase